MKHLLILNDPPYGTERSYNGLRMAFALRVAGRDNVVVLQSGLDGWHANAAWKP